MAAVAAPVEAAGFPPSEKAVVVGVVEDADVVVGGKNGAEDPAAEACD